MGHVKVNSQGQQIVVNADSNNAATGAEIKRQSSIPQDRVLTYVDGEGRTRAIADHEQVQLHEGMNIGQAPRFRYGSGTLPASEIEERLQRESDLISQLYAQTADWGYDPDIQRYWVHLQEFALPDGWNRPSTPIIVTVSDLYPQAAPDGFYLATGLRHKNGTTPGHYFESRSVHNPLAAAGWSWFCVHPDGWKPSHDIRFGDSILQYLTLVHLCLSEAVVRK